MKKLLQIGRINQKSQLSSATCRCHISKNFRDKNINMTKCSDYCWDEETSSDYIKHVHYLQLLNSSPKSNKIVQKSLWQKT